MQRPAGRAMNLSAPAYHRVVKLARTIADLAGSERIQPAHIAMPISDRPRSSTGQGGWRSPILHSGRQELAPGSRIIVFISLDIGSSLI